MVRRRGREAATSSLLPGYTHLTEIGGGAFATVFRAVEAETGRAVALKILKVDTIHAHLIETFHHEIQALAKVSDHPNIVTLYRPSTTTDGRPVLVLELCRESLAQQMRTGGPLAPVDVTRIGVKIAGALETAHRNGFLHRDMKPQNILVTQFGEPALADFGVAALQASAQVTAGVFGFTTLHAAPEMLEGHHLSPATDIYGLASTMYQLLTGQAPFATYDNEAPASVILRILRDPVRPLRADNIPLALADLLEAALSKEPEGRPRTALDFATALQAVEMSQDWPVTGYVAWGDEGSPGAPVTEVPTHLRPGPDQPWPVPGTHRSGGGRGAPAGTAGAPFPGPGPAPAGAGGAGGAGTREPQLYPTAPGVRVESVEPSAGRRSLPPLLPPSTPADPERPVPPPSPGQSASPDRPPAAGEPRPETPAAGPGVVPPAPASSEASPVLGPPPAPASSEALPFPGPPPAPAAPRRPSIEVPEPSVRNVVVPDSGRRGQPSRPLEPPTSPLAPLGFPAPPAPLPAAPSPAAPLIPPALSPSPAPPPPPPAHPASAAPTRPTGPPANPVAPAPVPARPTYIDPGPDIRRDGDVGVESVYERTTDVGKLFDHTRPPAPIPVPAPVPAGGRSIAGLPILVAAGIAVAAMVVLAAILVLLGVI